MKGKYMKAAIYEEYGPPNVLKMMEVAKPTPGDDQVLVKVVATTVSSGDVRMRKPDIPGSIIEKLLARLFLGINKPKRKILGMQIAGVVESVGKNVQRFDIGDEVFASTGMSFGGYAEYKCMPENSAIAKKPTNMSFEEASAVPIPGLGALALVKKSGVEKGKKVLVCGASGSVGTFTIQLAKYFGGEVTAVCSSGNFKLAKSLGASKTIDYNKEDFTKSKIKYDCVIDAIGKTLKSACKGIIAPNGKFISMHYVSYKDTVEDLIFLKTLIEKDKVKSVIDKVYPIERIGEAHEYVEKGHKKGNVIIQI